MSDDSVTAAVKELRDQLAQRGAGRALVVECYEETVQALAKTLADGPMTIDEEESKKIIEHVRTMRAMRSFGRAMKRIEQLDEAGTTAEIQKIKNAGDTNG